MKFTLAVLAAAALVSAQSPDDIPACARSCLNDAVKSKTSCSITDYACICEASNFSAVQTAATPCVLGACGPDVALNKVLPATQALCKAVGNKPAPKPSSSEAATTTAAEETTTIAQETTTVAEETTTEVVTSAPTYVVPTEGTTLISVPTIETPTDTPIETPIISTPGGVIPAPTGTYGTVTYSGPATGTTLPATSVPTAGAATVGSVGAMALVALAALAL